MGGPHRATSTASTVAAACKTSSRRERSMPLPSILTRPLATACDCAQLSMHERTESGRVDVEHGRAAAAYAVVDVHQPPVAHGKLPLAAARTIHLNPQAGNPLVGFMPVVAADSLPGHPDAPHVVMHVELRLVLHAPRFAEVRVHGIPRQEATSSRSPVPGRAGAAPPGGCSLCRTADRPSSKNRKSPVDRGTSWRTTRRPGSSQNRDRPSVKVPL